MRSPLQSVESTADIERELSRFPATGRSLLLVGGADFADCPPEVVDAIRRFLDRLARVCDATGAAVVDGGTDSGVMRWFAEAREAVGGTFPLVGVAPAGAFRRSSRTGASIRPAAGHSIVLAVPGDRFGDEQVRLFEVVDRLGVSAPTIVVNGGRLSLEEALLRLEGGHVVLTVEGSGRAADELAADEGLRASGRLRVISLEIDEPTLAAALEEAWTR
jgi:hypothetical protein